MTEASQNTVDSTCIQDKRFRLALTKMQFLRENFSDSREFVSGWLHDFVCPKCASLMKFDVVTENISPDKEFVCPNCKTKASGQKYLEAWVYRYRRYFAENLESVIVCIHAGNEQALSFLKSYVDFYADSYEYFPVHGQHAGKGKIMAQSLDEAVWGIYVLKAIYDCRSFFTEEQLNSWYQKLFALMAELLIPQVKSFNNISVWIQSCIGMVGLTFDKKDLTESALNGEFGLYKQLKKGLTEDYLWFEGSLHYHYYMLEGLTYFCELYAKTEPQSKLLLMLDKMYQAPSELIFDDHILSLNDGWYPLTLKDYAKQIIKAAVICKSKILFDQVAVIRNNFPEVFEDPGTLLYEREIDGNIRFHFNGHLAVMQKPFPVILKSGSCTANHMHRDYLSVLIPPFSVDLGTPGYGSKINESWYQSSLCHNTISIDGEQPKKLLDTVVRKTKDGVEAIVKDWPGITHISRRITAKGELIKEVTIVKADGEHIFDWIFHSEGEAEYNLKGIAIDSLGKGYEQFSDIQKIVFDKEFCAIFRDDKYGSLTVRIPYVKEVTIYTARTSGNPADHKRNTLLLRAKCDAVQFQAVFSMSKLPDESAIKIIKLTKEVKKLNHELKAVKNSKSYKLGSAIMFFPHKIKQWL